MRTWTLAILLCVVGAAWATPKPRAGAPARPARPPRSLTLPDFDAGPSNADRWRYVIADYIRGVRGGSEWPGGSFPKPFPIQVPLQGDNSGRSDMSVLVVPVPVPAPAASTAQCTPSGTPPSTVSYSNVGSSLFYPYPNQPPPHQNQVVVQVPPQPSVGPTVPTAPPTTPPTASPTAPPNQPPPQQPDNNYKPTEPSVTPVPTAPEINIRRHRNAPQFPPVANSRVLLEQFRAQAPDDSSLPPIIIDPVGVVSTDDYTVDELKASGSYRPTAPDSHNFLDGEKEKKRFMCKKRREPERKAQEREPPPPQPSFESSLFLKVRLTVPRADYTEPYSVWWDAASGASLMEFHGRATSTYRMVMSGGLVQSVQIRVDRTGEADVRHCKVSEPRRVSLAERALPALPDLSVFSFAGYVLYKAQRAELWRYTLSGHNGELGGARGEALTFRHELLVTRSTDNYYTTTPHWYSVRVDSSVLGVDADGYVHYFDEVTEQYHDEAIFHLNIADACDKIENTNRMESIEPLREFTSLRRLPRYDKMIGQYKQTFGRTYADDLEEAVRRAILIQSTRFVEAGNRQGASFSLEINFLADRLVVERLWLMGVEESPYDDQGIPFPHSLEQIETLRGRLPRSFDWRERGGVTRVRSQKALGRDCKSCWAFATVGAVEGALFRKSGRLVELSEQVLVDCAGGYGGHGCNPGTWPSVAYNYIKYEGIPARDEYTTYAAKQLECRANSVPVVTKITDHYNVTANKILAIKYSLKKYGPTVVIVNADVSSFVKYATGFYYDGRCDKTGNRKNLHAVLAVGWTVYRGETFFILKNSWSTAWGESGYMRMRATTNTCGVLGKPSVPLLNKSDVKRVPGAALVAAGPT